MTNNETIKTKSLQEYVLDSISSVLFKEQFPSCEVTPEGILSIVDAIAAYYEEGRELFPHIIITTNLSDLLKPIPFRQIIEIRKMPLCVKEFSTALKLNAPIAVNGWIIFIEIDISNKKLRSGLVSVELSETSPSLHRQLIGDLGPAEIDSPVIYISNIGQRTVLIEGKKTKTAVSLSLKTVTELFGEATNSLASCMSKDCEPELSKMIIPYFEKLLNTAVKECHGTLIAVVKDDFATVHNL